MSTTFQSMHALFQDSYLLAAHDDYLETLYDAYLTQPETLTAEWRLFFETLAKETSPFVNDVSHRAIQADFLERARRRSVVHPPAATLSSGTISGMSVDNVLKQYASVLDLIKAYRCLGHMRANIDPLQRLKQGGHPYLDLSFHQLNANDTLYCPRPPNFLNHSSREGNALPKIQTIAQLLAILERMYCGHIGFEYMHMTHLDEIEWCRQRIEEQWLNFSLAPTEQRRILNDLIAADGLEKYLGMKYVGQKRFSLEGGDALIPLLRVLMQNSVAVGVKEVVLGMAHRGRLNVLVNILGKASHEVFAAFEGKGVSETHSGDVKYHLGYSADLLFDHRSVHVALAFNPSHLEIIAPVVQGSVRARQCRSADTERQYILPIHVHGDAAIAGQGVVMETFNMSETRWFSVGGSIHIVINNQVGFTTSCPKDARSTRYCTDIGKMVEAPILHVNGNDPEAVYFAASFAADYRHTFKRDVIIDLVCYRRHGHNEADEPSATQPLMYQIIKTMPPVRTLYATQLIQQGVIDQNEEKKQMDAYHHALEAGESVVPLNTGENAYPFQSSWIPYFDQVWTAPSKTAVSKETLDALSKQMVALPPDFVLQPQVKKVWDARVQMSMNQAPINWGYAENLAYATLLVEGYSIRLCGQDVGRGTFAHRHAVLHDQQRDQIYIPLNHVAEKQATIDIVDSLLSEEAVLAFEYGYATTDPNHLVIWEAQFGDFANGAQVVIDQFLSSGEQKWLKLCGLVVLLPHGYEGQGPEHSSARLERYLQLCAQHNLQVCVPSTPAQIFHLLRRQMIRPYRKPLIVMTPKSLLRHRLAVSSFAEFSEHEFHTLLPEVDLLAPEAVKRVVFCSGKVYYELIEKRRALQINDIAIVRLEQLYPFPAEACRLLLAQYKSMEELVWCQEEPKNQGAWLALHADLSALLATHQSLQYAGRHASASPAAGYHAVHMKEQDALVLSALTRKMDST